jgi:hypothetical protein
MPVCSLHEANNPPLSCVAVPQELWERMVSFTHGVAHNHWCREDARHLSKWLQLLESPLGTGVQTVEK